MATYFEEPCSQCNKSHWIQNKTKHLCGDCVYENNHDGKSRFEVLREKQALKPYKVSTIKRKPLKTKLRKPTGEGKLFLEIWEEREHICSNPKCKVDLGEEPLVYFFSHDKSKGADASQRLNKEQISLLCWPCHFEKEFGMKF